MGSWRCDNVRHHVPAYYPCLVTGHTNRDHRKVAIRVWLCMEIIAMAYGLGRPLAALVPSDEERSWLEGQVRRRRIARSMSDRCRMILRCADGLGSKAVGDEPGGLGARGRRPRRAAARSPWSRRPRGRAGGTPLAAGSSSPWPAIPRPPRAGRGGACFGRRPPISRLLPAMALPSARQTLLLQSCCPKGMSPAPPQAERARLRRGPHGFPAGCKPTCIVGADCAVEETLEPGGKGASGRQAHPCHAYPS